MRLRATTHIFVIVVSGEWYDDTHWEEDLRRRDAVAAHRHALVEKVDVEFDAGLSQSPCAVGRDDARVKRCSALHAVIRSNTCASISSRGCALSSALWSYKVQVDLSVSKNAYMRRTITLVAVFT